ncbi:hypothetical protein [Metamycoplasma neophronis]|uniref:Uncharacterized protein n=1 Tax=Metamycoplasma neophronis TaxID=872983 RepID=A0ABY2Z573_9BACT|nr:hypothetical protein [Metamycoplasma neophronis]TPR54653.1 hypothetical protein FJR74_00045 [Metamycoplasma neophronis]
MDNRKNELKKLKNYEIHSIWYWILILLVIFAAWSLIIYISVVFKNRYEDTLQVSNDIIVSIIVGLISGLLLVLASFIFLDLFKRYTIKDFFEYYAYLNSLHDKSKFSFFKDPRVIEFYSIKKPITKSKFIDVIAGILNYSKMSIEYGNLINEVNSDFAKHGFLDPNYKKQKQVGITRTIVLNLVIPIIIIAILVAFAIKYFDLNESLREITRLLIILAATIFSLSISIFIYEIHILSKVKNIETFNNFNLLSFNIYAFRYLNSSSVKR